MPQHYLCPECGNRFDAASNSCPNCGCPKASCTPITTPDPDTPCLRHIVDMDLGKYIYESGLLYHDSLTMHYADFKGRASRRELWTYVFNFWFCIGLLGPVLLLWPLVLVYAVFALIGFFSVWVRRMHDINLSGWWCLCPIAWFFLGMKPSDKYPNKYGAPRDYSHIQ